MWLTNSKTRIFFDMHFPDWADTDIAKNFNPDHIADTFYKKNVDSVILYAKCQYGNFYYNTRLGHKHSGLGDLDLFNEVKDRLHKTGIKVIAYYSVSWDEWVSEQHPEWLTKRSDGLSDTEEFRWKTLCINSPYRDTVLAHLKEIMTIAKPDGFWIDMTIIGKDRCHCQYCNEKFKEIYGIDIPISPNEKNYNLFMQFRYNYIEEFYSEIRSLVKGLDKDVVVTNNYWGYPYSNATMGSRAVGALRYADFITGEAYTDWTGLNAPSFFSKFLRGAARDRPYEVLIGRFYNTWDYTVKPYEQLAYEAYSTIANGATVTVDDEPYHDGQIDKALYDNIGKIFHEIKKREDYLGGNPLKYAAILHSQETKDYYNEYGNEAFIRSIAGAYKMLRDLHYSLDFIFDEGFDDHSLQGYKVIIMPSVAVVSKKMMDKVKQYVTEGGTLLMSGPTAIYYVQDNQLVMDLSILREAFDIQQEGMGDYSLSYMKLTDPSLSEGQYFERPSLIKGKYVKYKDIEFGKAAIVEPICETTKKTFFHNNLPSPYKITDNPALIVKKAGRGSIICFAQPIFAHYAKQSQTELRSVMKSVLHQYVSKPIIEFQCPNRMDVSVWKKKGSLIVHLLNPNPGMSVCCGYMDPFEGAYPRTLEYMDEIIPVNNIKIIVKTNQIGTVKTVGEQTSFQLDKRDGYSVITLEQVKLWETIVIDMNK